MIKVKRYTSPVLIGILHSFYYARCLTVSYLNVTFQLKNNYYSFNYSQTFSDLLYVSNNITYLNYGCDSNYSLKYSCIYPEYLTYPTGILPKIGEMCGTFIGMLHFRDILYSGQHFIHNKKCFQCRP